MKELSIEQKAKAYDKALERAKEKYPTCYSPALLEYIFPELKESKDNEIRKDIISNLKRYINCIKDGYDTHSAKNFIIKDIEKQIAWLEKQGNKPATILEELNLNKLEKQGQQEFIDSDILIQQQVDTLSDIDAKQSSTDNVKPKIENEIEIPFGAKDSELQKAIYYIPKGFYAEIDNDKVVIKKGEKAYCLE